MGRPTTPTEMIVMEGGGKLILLGGPPFSPAAPTPRDLPAMRNIHVEVERIYSTCKLRIIAIA